MVKNMDHRSVETTEAAVEYKSTEEVRVTEELDEKLRSHRPRAGQIEADVRQKRAVELIGQKRRMEVHLLAQSKNTLKEESRIAAKIEDAQKQLDSAICRVENYGGLFRACLSTKALEIRQRELESLDVSTKDVDPECNALIDLCSKVCQKIQAANTAFDQRWLKPPEDGGDYSPENIDKYKGKLAKLDYAIEKVAKTLQDKVEDMRAEYQKKVLSRSGPSRVVHFLSSDFYPEVCLLPSHPKEMLS